jgi:hypothetical protein
MTAFAENIDVQALATGPLPTTPYDGVLLGHGSGGTLCNDLVKKLVVPGFADQTLDRLVSGRFPHRHRYGFVHGGLSGSAVCRPPSALAEELWRRDRSHGHPVGDNLTGGRVPAIH